MRVGLIACCKQKLNHAAPARDLYISPLFKKSRAWIETRVDAWAILSARHCLVLPDQVLEPYDQQLTDLSLVNRDRWGEEVQRQILDEWDEDAIFMILAGEEYKRAVKRLPYVEDVIRHWTDMRRDSGMSSRRATMSIGLILKALKEGRSYGG